MQVRLLLILMVWQKVMVLQGWLGIPLPSHPLPVPNCSRSYTLHCIAAHKTLAVNDDNARNEAFVYPIKKITS